MTEALLHYLLPIAAMSLGLWLGFVAVDALTDRYDG